MASNVYVKSLFWLVSIGGIGYGLLRLTEPSAEKLKQIRASTSSVHLTEDEQKKLLFMKRIQQAAQPQSQPIYLKTKDN